MRGAVLLLVSAASANRELVEAGSGSVAPSFLWECSQDWCTSPDTEGGTDCWAGSHHERCTCSRGMAKVDYENPAHQTEYEV